MNLCQSKQSPISAGVSVGSDDRLTALATLLREEVAVIPKEEAPLDLRYALVI